MSMKSGRTHFSKQTMEIEMGMHLQSHVHERWEEPLAIFWVGDTVKGVC